MAKAITLRKIPDDVFQILLKEQGRIKEARRVGMFGIEQTVYNIIRDYERCKKVKEDNK